jgi:hypothetical protein
MRFSGDAGTGANTNPAFSFWRAGLTPARVSFTPLGAIHVDSPKGRALLRLIHVQFETVFIPAGFAGTDFGNAKTAYKVNTDVQGRTQILIDGAAVIRAFRQ